jgi:hypothetical protein
VKTKDKPLTALERLILLRENKMVEMQRIIADLDELENQIVWLQRFPMLEKIMERLRKI